MATFVRRARGVRWRVAVRGDLGVTDLRRLEQACAPALEHFPLPLDLQVEALSAVDEPARRFVACLLRRGASLTGDVDGRWQAIIAAPAQSTAAVASR